MGIFEEQCRLRRYLKRLQSIGNMLRDLQMLGNIVKIQKKYSAVTAKSTVYKGFFRCWEILQVWKKYSAFTAKPAMSRAFRIFA